MTETRATHARHKHFADGTPRIRGFAFRATAISYGVHAGAGCDARHAQLLCVAVGRAGAPREKEKEKKNPRGAVSSRAQPHRGPGVVRIEPHVIVPRRVSSPLSVSLLIAAAVRRCLPPVFLFSFQVPVKEGTVVFFSPPPPAYYYGKCLFGGVHFLFLLWVFQSGAKKEAHDEKTMFFEKKNQTNIICRYRLRSISTCPYAYSDNCF